MTNEDVMTAMHETDRGPGDYSPPPWDDERRILINIIRRQTDSAGGGNYNEAPNGSNVVVIGVGITIIASFIIGGWIVSNRVSALEGKFGEWQSAAQRQIDIMNSRLDRMENHRL